MESAATAPVSATEIARVLELPRQKVNYHVRVLADAGLLEAAGERPRRGLTEKLYRASARAYVVSAEVLGTLAPSVERFRDGFGAATLVSLASRMQTEVGQAAEQARERGKRLATLSLDTEVTFENAEQQAAFSEALGQAVADVVARFSSPDDGRIGHRYRVVAAAYPPPHPVEPPKPIPPGERVPDRGAPSTRHLFGTPQE